MQKRLAYCTQDDPKLPAYIYIPVKAEALPYEGASALVRQVFLSGLHLLNICKCRKPVKPVYLCTSCSTCLHIYVHVKH